MGSIIFQKTIKPIRVYLYDNNNSKDIFINGIFENEDKTYYVRKFLLKEYELPILLELLYECEKRIKVKGV